MPDLPAVPNTDGIKLYIPPFRARVSISEDTAASSRPPAIKAIANKGYAASATARACYASVLGERLTKSRRRYTWLVYGEWVPGPIMTSELVCSITAHDAAHGVGLFTVQWPFPTRTEEDEEDTNFVADPGPQWDLWYGKLDACRTLQEGWNGYTAPAPGDAAIENARTFLDVMRQAGLGPTRLAPSAMGGVAVTQKAGNRKVLVEFYNDGRAFALFSLRGGDMRVAPVALGVDAFRHFLDEMREYLNV